MISERISGFDPVYSPDAVVLICGTMPSVASLKQSFYYGHPRNAFWPMIASILGEALPGSPQTKADMLIRHRIALWDVCASCEREGSLDSAIHDVVPNDFSRLFDECRDIRHILFNGATAMMLYRKYISKEDENKTFHKMPSTSPAFTMPFIEKERIWRETLAEVLK